MTGSARLLRQAIGALHEGDLPAARRIASAAANAAVDERIETVEADAAIRLNRTLAELVAVVAVANHNTTSNRLQLCLWET